METDECELEGAQIGDAREADKAWAGGRDGMQVTERVLGEVEQLLSEAGVFYLVAIKQNKPEEIVRRMEERGLVGEVRI